MPGGGLASSFIWSQWCSSCLILKPFSCIPGPLFTGSSGFLDFSKCCFLSFSCCVGSFTFGRRVFWTGPRMSAGKKGRRREDMLPDMLDENEVAKAIDTRFPEAITAAKTAVDGPVIEIHPSRIVTVCGQLKAAGSERVSGFRGV